MNTHLKHLLKSERFISFLYRFVRIYAGTLRLRVENEQPWLTHLENGGSVLLCTWHQQFFTAIRPFETYRRFNPTIMISRSNDGTLIAGVAQHAGWHTVRGSSSKGGREALRNVIARLAKSKLAGHIVDGPRGPAGLVKAGVIRLAHQTNAVIVPFYTHAENRWLFNSWDRFLLPKPFSRVHLRFGDMLKFDPTRDAAIFEKQRARLEKIMQPGLVH
ncbi:MAG: lysophospholipid acyltransferase family protein [Desulfobacterales bacterium]|nr:lysophospholipid acyltransferase family protein [Desulfobacterales bacterium]